MKPVIIGDEALTEIEEACDYIENRRRGYGALLREAIEAEIGRIQRHPEWFTVFRTDYRRLVMRKFSYNIYFRELDAYVWIAAVSHQSREQTYWMDRNPSED